MPYNHDMDGRTALPALMVAVACGQASREPAPADPMRSPPPAADGPTPDASADPSEPDALQLAEPTALAILAGRGDAAVPDAGLAVWIGPDALYFGELGEPKAASRLLAVTDGRLDPSALANDLVSPLYGALVEAVDQRRAGNGVDALEVAVHVLADRGTRSRVLDQVLYTAARAEAALRLVVAQRGELRSRPLAHHWATPPESPDPVAGPWAFDFELLDRAQPWLLVALARPRGHAAHAAAWGYPAPIVVGDGCDAAGADDRALTDLVAGIAQTCAAGAREVRVHMPVAETPLARLAPLLRAGRDDCAVHLTWSMRGPDPRTWRDRRPPPSIDVERGCVDPVPVSQLTAAADASLESRSKDDRAVWAAIRRRDATRPDPEKRPTFGIIAAGADHTSNVVMRVLDLHADAIAACVLEETGGTRGSHRDLHNLEVHVEPSGALSLATASRNLPPFDACMHERLPEWRAPSGLPGTPQDVVVGFEY